MIDYKSIENDGWCAKSSFHVEQPFFCYAFKETLFSKLSWYNIQSILTKLVGIPTLSAAEKANEKFLLFSC